MSRCKLTSYTFEIDNFSEKKAWIDSPTFLSGGCEWLLTVHPKGDYFEDHLAVYLYVVNPKSSRPGWKIRVNYCFILLNQSGKELKRKSAVSNLFCAEVTGWGYSKMMPLSKLKEEGFLEKNKLIIKVEVKVVEVVHEGELTGKEVLHLRGFHIFYAQVVSVTRLFDKHPDIAIDFKPKDKGVKTAYMNLLLGLINTLCKPPQSFSETELRNAHGELSELTEAGFKLDWLKTKLEEVFLERKNAIADGSRIEEVKEQIKNLELTLSDLKVKSDAAAAKHLSFEDIL